MDSSGAHSPRSMGGTTRSSAMFVPADLRDHATQNGTEYASLYLVPSSRHHDPSLRSTGSRVSLREQFATTRKEIEFGFDDGVSFADQSEDDQDHEVQDTGDDEALITPGSFGSVVVVPPVREVVEEATAVDTEIVQRMPRTHHELLCLPEGSAVAEVDIRRAYYRLYDTLRSSRVPAHYRVAAAGYFSQVQSAFETLIGMESRQEYGFVAVGQGNETESSEDDHIEDAKSAAKRHTKPGVVKKLRRQQEQGSMEVGLQMDAQPFFPPNHDFFRDRRNVPAGISLTRTVTTKAPSVSRLLQPKARRLYYALRTPPTPGESEKGKDLELYCTAPTVTMSSSVVAMNARGVLPAPSAALVAQQNIITNVVPEEDALPTYATYLSPRLSIKLRQEVFQRKAGLSETSLRKTLPDTVLELEADTLNTLSVTARASHSIRLQTEGIEVEPVHIEASVSCLARSRSRRLGLAIHRNVSPKGTAFACLDSGSPSLWERPSFVEQHSIDARWRGQMDGAASFLGQVLSPFFSSLPTAEAGYKFSGSQDNNMGMTYGRPFTKQIGSGIRRLHDNASLGEAWTEGSWTVSGAVTPCGCAAYMRYGRDLCATRSRSWELEPSRSSQSRGWQDRLGFRVEAELSTQKMKNGVICSSAPWSRSELSNLAVRGLKKIGKSFRLGLELGVSNASNSVVLSIYLSRRNDWRLIIPIMLFRGTPLMDQRAFSPGVRALFWTAFVPALGFAAIDYLTPSITAEPLHGENKKNGREAQDQARQKIIQDRVSHRRAEADDLVVMLAQPVLHRQRLQRENGGLVIVSAKYGVLADPRTASSPSPIWAASEDVADVTIAVAALVDDKGTLCIPEGLKKSRLLGFWDPKPGRTKWLVVKYVWSGREMTNAVAGRDELCLP